MFYFKTGGNGVLHEKTAGGPFMTESVALSLAYLLDLLIGDPQWAPHPVRGIGWGIAKMEGLLRKYISCFEQRPQDIDKAGSSDSDIEIEEVRNRINISDIVQSFFRRKRGLSIKEQEKLAGCLLVAAVVGATFLLFYLLRVSLFSLTFSPIAEYIALAVYIYFISTTIATRALLHSGQAVIQELKQGDTESARLKLSMIVGRDTSSLNETGVLRATVETLAENASDGIIAPMFYFLVGGLPLAMVYKAINTLDSMVGYKNEKFKNFGWAAAKLDDIANYIPSRITGGLIVAAGFLVNHIRHIVDWTARRFNNVKNSTVQHVVSLLSRLEQKMKETDFESGINAYRIMVRDGKKHASPNSGIPEAAMAGALGVKLGGPSIYEGVTVRKPYIGDERKKTGRVTQSTEHIYLEASDEALILTKLASFLGLIISLLVL
jgi:adenosylcobinamide-phosphate synthase